MLKYHYIIEDLEGKNDYFKNKIEKESFMCIFRKMTCNDDELDDVYE